MPRASSSPTLKQVADRVGCHITAVSKVLNRSGSRIGVSQDLRERIEQVGRELGYRPNLAARAMKAGKFSTLAIVLPARSVGAGLTFPADMLGSIADAAAANQMNIVLADLWLDRLASDAEYVPGLLRNLCADGVLVQWVKQFGDIAERSIADTGLPVVWMNDRREHDSVFPDDEGGGHLATERLISQGHTRVAYCCFMPPKHFSVIDRGRGVHAALRRRGLEPVAQPGFVDAGDHPRSRIEGVRRWLRQADRPTGIVAYSHRETMTLLRAASMERLSVEQDLALVQFDSPGMTHHAAGIDTVELPWREVGVAAVNLILEKLRGGKRSPGRAMPCKCSWKYVYPSSSASM